MTIWIVLFFAFLFKVPAFTQPFIGYFASYQAINAMMGEMMARGGDFVSWLTPRSFLLMEGNPSLHLLYYPFGAAAAALLSKLGGSIAFWGRFQAALFTFLAGWMLAKSLNAYEPDEKKKTWAVLFFSFSPMVLVEGVCFQNEAVALFFLTGAFLLVARPTSLLRALGAGVLFSLAMTARLHFIFLGPVFLYLLATGRASFLNWVFFGLGSLVPLCGWYAWTWVLEHQFPAETATSMFSQSKEGRIMTASLFTSVPFYIQLAKTLSIQLLTPLGLIAALAGFWKAPRSQNVFRIWFLAALIPVIALPQKTQDHPFYLIAAVPAAAVLAASGFELLWVRSRKLCALFLGLFFLVSVRYYMPPAFSFGGDRDIPAIGRKIQELSAPDDKIIASHGTSNDLLFYSNRLGWAFDLKMAEHPMDEQERHIALKKRGYGDPKAWLMKLKAEGARYFVITEPEIFAAQRDFFDFVTRTYREVPSGSPVFRIFDLGVKA